MLRAAATRDGRRWPAPVRLARGASTRPGKLEAALDAGGRGVAVWSERGERVLATRLDVGRILGGRP